MGIGDRWLRWWDRFTHGEAEQAHDRVAAGRKETRAAPESARPVGKVPTGPDGELKLSIDPGNRPISKRKKVGSAGFDPYANDAGYEKPRNWDDVDPR
jgi:hypothetical protein